MDEHAGAREVRPRLQLIGVGAEHHHDLLEAGVRQRVQRPLDQRPSVDEREQLAAAAGRPEARAGTGREQQPTDLHANRPKRRPDQSKLRTSPSQISSAAPRPSAGASLKACPEPPVATTSPGCPGTRSTTGLPSGVKS